MVNRGLGTAIALGALFLGVLAAACGGDDGETLTIYSGRTRDLVEPILESFSKETGVHIRVRYGDTAELAATILEEGRNSPADVFFAQDAGALGAMVEAGRFKELPDGILQRVPQQYRAPDKRWVGVSARARVLAFNPEKVREQDLPASVLELTDAKWRNRVSWAPTNGSFQAFVTALRRARGQEGARDWLLAMKANGTRAYANNVAQVQAVAAGEVDVALVNHYYLYPLLKERGEGFKARNHFFTDGDIGGMVNVAGAGILDTSKHDAVARRFVEFLLSREAQQYFAEHTYEYPLAAGVTPPAEVPALSTLQPPAVDLNGLHDLSGTLALLRETGVLP
ncbi:MAG: iron ABC transporter substrate-binding protein [Dehalococcoidia bacterium]|nr:MAG: iron ABC transporter substrate-binding protein [Dehalococcoidia bacterium]